MYIIAKKTFFLCLIFSLLFSCNKTDDLSDSGEESSKDSLAIGFDTIDYRALVWVEESDLERYGGKEEFQKGLDKMFHETSMFWNEASTHKFKYYFRFVPTGIKTYKIDGKGKNDEATLEQYQSMQYVTWEAPLEEEYDYAVFLGLSLPGDSPSNACSWTDGYRVVWSYWPKSTHIFKDSKYPEYGAYGNLGHEYGHVRGSQDLYQYRVSAQTNPINHEAYPVPECNMGTGIYKWSDYCSALFNHVALYKRLPNNYLKELFPETVTIKVLKDGKPVNRASVKLWGTTGKSAEFDCRVWDEAPFLNTKTTSSGELKLYNVYDMFYNPFDYNGGVCPSTDEMPYWRWFCFLIEAYEGTDPNALGVKKGYAWLSDLDIVPYYYETGNENFVLEVNLK